jgi:hypothetical protein
MNGKSPELPLTQKFVTSKITKLLLMQARLFAKCVNVIEFMGLSKAKISHIKVKTG